LFLGRILGEQPIERSIAANLAADVAEYTRRMELDTEAAVRESE
jgi:hypothetical protein